MKGRVTTIIPAISNIDPNKNDKRFSLPVTPFHKTRLIRNKAFFFNTKKPIN
jgi:hypothetical protein